MSVPAMATALIEALDSHGRVQWRERFALNDERRRLTIGRSLEADLTLDDPFAAALHAAIEITPEGRVFASDLGSDNGIVVAGKRHQGASDVEVTGGTLQVGRTRLRIRTSHETLAPEKPDQRRPATWLHDPKWIAGIGATAAAAQTAYATWFDAPRDMTTTVVTALVAICIASSLWIAFWALLSRVIVGQGRWLRHAAIFLGVAVATVVIDGVLGVTRFALSLPPWETLAAWAGAAVMALLLYLHVTTATNLSRRRAAIIACIVPALLVGAGNWAQARQQVRNVNYIGDSLRIYPPGLRLRQADTIESLFEDAASLRAAADEKRDATKQDADESDAFDDEE
jgi:pSer/pThr/pTyr-binding forkhead associated (FHA) protein